MTYTGGALNWLNGQCRSSNPQESVHVMSLIQEHDPEDPDELYEEINRHYEEDCGCGIESGGTVEDFGDWLYECQMDKWGEYRFTREECRQWIYDLFIMQSLKGHGVEQEARELFERSFDVRDVDGRDDIEHRVDLVVFDGENALAGLQVKPESYKNIRESVKHRNEEAHQDIEEPIFYLYYTYKDEKFINAETVMSNIYKLI